MVPSLIAIPALPDPARTADKALVSDPVEELTHSRRRIPATSFGGGVEPHVRAAAEEVCVREAVDVVHLAEDVGHFPRVSGSRISNPRWLYFHITR